MVWPKLRFGRVDAFKQARPTHAAKSRSMLQLGLQIITPGFGRAWARQLHDSFSYSGQRLRPELTAYKVRLFPRLSPHTPCCDVLADRAFVRPESFAHIGAHLGGLIQGPPIVRTPVLVHGGQI